MSKLGFFDISIITAQGVSCGNDMSSINDIDTCNQQLDNLLRETAFLFYQAETEFNSDPHGKQKGMELAPHLKCLRRILNNQGSIVLLQEYIDGKKHPIGVNINYVGKDGIIAQTHYVDSFRRPDHLLAHYNPDADKAMQIMAQNLQEISLAVGKNLHPDSEICCITDHNRGVRDLWSHYHPIYMEGNRFAETCYVQHSMRR